MREVWRRRRGGIDGGVVKGCVGSDSDSAEGVVRGGSWPAADGVGRGWLLVGGSASGMVRVVSCEAVDGVVEACESSVEEVLSELSSRWMFMIGISRAVLMNFSSRLGGRPFLAMRSAFRTRMERSLGWERRYMVSSPASTVSETARMRLAIMALRDGYCDNSARQCRDDVDSLSK